jgi:hypothetical protein
VGRRAVGTAAGAGTAAEAGTVAVGIVVVGTVAVGTVGVHMDWDTEEGSQVVGILVGILGSPGLDWELELELELVS